MEIFITLSVYYSMTMKTIKICAAALLLCSVAAVSCKNSGRNTSAPAALPEYSEKVVIKDGEVAGLLVEEKKNTYVVSVQDDVEISKRGAHVELWKASDGKGAVWLKDWGKQNVYAGPDTASEVVGTLTYEEGCLPDSYPCLGYENGWFALSKDGRKVFAPASALEWSAICTF